ncbi:MAG: beta-N-acetylhexosaminidase [Halothiobacillaceae bacterium]|nr:MAG: beta-N-acetylhexosaminidase [Halothiobacillaceae bacterium]
MNGPVMVDLAGLDLQPDEAVRLRHPLVGGLILFARNYADPDQLHALVQSVRAVRPDIIIAVDHEGGRVQRFREGFTRVPPASMLGDIYADDPQQGVRLARDWAWLLASELRAFDIDLTFAPVLDLGGPLSRVIGDRALHTEPEAISVLGQAWMEGMRDAGMAAVGKHVPGHGSVVEDSHVAFPLDQRPLSEIEALDLLPFRRLIDAGLPAVMMAHVIYPKIDSLPAGFSSVWVEEILRQRYGFDGVVFTDDLSMAAATTVADPVERARMALQAGCDMLLVCNRPEDAEAVLAGLGDVHDPSRSARLAAMRATTPVSLAQLRASPRFQQTAATMAACV